MAEESWESGCGGVRGWGRGDCGPVLSRACPGVGGWGVGRAHARGPSAPQEPRAGTRLLRAARVALQRAHSPGPLRADCPQHPGAEAAPSPSQPGGGGAGGRGRARGRWGPWVCARPPPARPTLLPRPHSPPRRGRRAARVSLRPAEPHKLRGVGGCRLRPAGLREAPTAESGRRAACGAREAGRARGVRGASGTWNCAKAPGAHGRGGKWGVETAGRTRPGPAVWADAPAEGLGGDLAVRLPFSTLSAAPNPRRRLWA